MKHLFGIIADYQGRLTMLPIMILVFATLTLLLYVFFPKKRAMKYFPGLVGIVVGIFWFIMGCMQFTKPQGLSYMWMAIYFFVAGCIGLGTAWIVALLTWNERGKKRKVQRRRA